jgi:hypothetical protein
MRQVEDLMMKSFLAILCGFLVLTACDSETADVSAGDSTAEQGLFADSLDSLDSDSSDSSGTKCKTNADCMSPQFCGKQYITDEFGQCRDQPRQNRPKS